MAVQSWHWTMGCLLLCALCFDIPVVLGLTSEGFARISSEITDGNVEKKHKHNPFSSPSGLFIQERASKQLPGPGQHFSFGALVSWDKIHEILDNDTDSKLFLVVRHGQAVSNYLSDYLGPDKWFDVEEKCSYQDDDGTMYDVFDAELTEMGTNEATSLNSQLYEGKKFDMLTAGKPVHGIVSPLSRCLHTALLVTKNLQISKFGVEEAVRETLGEDTCDARRSASDPDPSHPDRLTGPCNFEKGLRSKYPEFEFPIVPQEQEPECRPGFGLWSDKDELWTQDREGQKHQTKRAARFLEDVFRLVEEKVVLVITHSGFTRSLLLAVGREPYRPQNSELVPVIVHKNSYAHTTS